MGLTGGSVSLDGTAQVRGSCDLTFADDGSLGLVPTDSDSLLAPFGNEIRIWRGILLPDGWEQLVSIGIFRIQTSTPNEDGGGGFTISVSGFDRAQQIQEADFLVARTIASGSGLFDTVKQIILEVDVDAVFNFPDDSTKLLPKIDISEGDDRWQWCQDVVAAIGMDLYLNGDGEYTIRPIPTLEDDPVAEMVEGDGGLLTSASPSWTREGGFNGVVYTGNNPNDSGDPPRGQALDTDVNSPTYWYGKYGQVPVFEQSEFLIDDTQAQTAAQGKLNKEKGVHKSINFGGVIDPTLEPDDVIYIKRTKIGIDENHILDSYTIPLDATQPAGGQTRAQVRV